MIYPRNIDYESVIDLIKFIGIDELNYLNATQLCILLFSFQFEKYEKLSLSKEELGILFSRMVNDKIININWDEDVIIAEKFGVHRLCPQTSEHWVAVCMSVLKAGSSVNDLNVQNKLIRLLKS